MKNLVMNSQSTDPPLTLSIEAAYQVKRLMSMGNGADSAVRITLNPLGHIREKYQLEFINPQFASAQDEHYDIHGIHFVIDKTSASLLAHTSMQYVEGMWSSGFRFENHDRFRLMADPRSRAIDHMINEVINPLAAMHGGKITLQDVREHEVFLEMSGSCQGCGLAPSTIRDLVDQTIKQRFPDIVAVHDITDHAAGRNPYYVSKESSHTEAP